MRYDGPILFRRRTATIPIAIATPLFVALFCLVPCAAADAAPTATGGRHFLAGPRHEATVSIPTPTEMDAHGPPGRWRKLMAELDLTAEQRRRLRASLPQLQRRGEQARTRHEAQVQSSRGKAAKTQEQADAHALPTGMQRRSRLDAAQAALLRRELGDILTEDQLDRVVANLQARFRQEVRGPRRGRRLRAGPASRPGQGPSATQLNL